MHNEDQLFIAPGFDANLHVCATCLDSGISQEDAGYCTCRMGKRIEQLDNFAAQLKGHGFTEAMRMVFRSTQKTERAIAAAEKALLLDKIAKLEAKQQWQPIETAPKISVWSDGAHNYAMHILASDGYNVVHCRWWYHNDGSGNFIQDGNRAFFPSHWMPLPAAPGSAPSQPQQEAVPAEPLCFINPKRAQELGGGESVLTMLTPNRAFPEDVALYSDADYLRAMQKEFDEYMNDSGAQLFKVSFAEWRKRRDPMSAAKEPDHG